MLQLLSFANARCRMATFATTPTQHVREVAMVTHIASPQSMLSQRSTNYTLNLLQTSIPHQCTFAQSPANFRHFN